MSINEYLDKSEQLIQYAQSIIKDNPEEARYLLTEQLQERVKLLVRFQNN